MFVWRSKECAPKQGSIGNLEKSCSGLENSCHDMEKSGEMLKKKIHSYGDLALTGFLSSTFNP